MTVLPVRQGASSGFYEARRPDLKTKTRVLAANRRETDETFRFSRSKTPFDPKKIIAKREKSKKKKKLSFPFYFGQVIQLSLLCNSIYAQREYFTRDNINFAILHKHKLQT